VLAAAEQTSGTVLDGAIVLPSRSALQSVGSRAPRRTEHQTTLLKHHRNLPPPVLGAETVTTRCSHVLHGRNAHRRHHRPLFFGFGFPSMEKGRCRMVSPPRPGHPVNLLNYRKPGDHRNAATNAVVSIWPIETNLTSCSASRRATIPHINDVIGIPSDIMLPRRRRSSPYTEGRSLV